MCKIRHLDVFEPVIVDPDRMVELCVALGESGAETLVMQSLADLSEGMNRLERHYFAEDWPNLMGEAAKLQKIATHIGMTTMARVLGDVMDCLEIDETTSLAATITRLRRITDKSLGAAWEMQGAS